MAAKLDNDDLLTCPICFEHFVIPKCLPCLHTFCYQCLRSYIISHLGGEGKNAVPFPCPVCRKEVPIPDASLPSEEIVDVMPGNHLINSLIDRQMASREGQRERSCDPCNYDSRETPASLWCTVCLEGLCENCASCHKAMKMSRNHKLLPVSDLTENTQCTPLLEVDEPCLKHAGKVLEVYCSDHKEMCCVLCLATNHRQCKHISTLEEMVSGSENLESVADFVGYLKQVDQKTQEVKVKTENNIKNLDMKQDEISEKVLDTVRKAKDRLDELQSNFITNLKQTHKEQRTKLTERKERVEIFQSCVKKADKLLDVVSKQGSQKQLFVTKEKIKIQLQNQMENLRNDLQDVDHIDYGLEMADSVMSVNESLESLAELKINNATWDLSDNVLDILRIMDKCCNREPEKVDITKITATQACKFGSGHYGGGAFLPDGRLVLCSVTTKSLQIFDRSGTKLFEIQLNDEPRDVCLVSDCEIIVSFPKSNLLKKYEVSKDTIMQSNEFPCKSSPIGLVATKHNIIVGCCKTVDMLTLGGQYIGTIKNKQNVETLTYVAQSIVTTICFCDSEDICCVTLDGKELWRFNNPKLQNVFGIAVDKYSNIFACGLNSRNVCVFSPDGKSFRTLIENIACPNGIGFNHQGTRFFIATAYGVFLYDIKYN